MQTNRNKKQPILTNRLSQSSSMNEDHYSLQYLIKSLLNFNENHIFVFERKDNANRMQNKKNQFFFYAEVQLIFALRQR
ncbi:hypothetical protein DWW10_10850 [Bacteroides intestinalis]|uniref:Uncharacterized protein n=1 Tax=Bacteroides intestinalis TaxID=329854 RepID=A0A412Y9H6_9BACE|nr:hypothetical protein DWW10_10850 [Bacteroides intestinalis]RHA59744.1 hypothetical protein DW932_12225 [Bacteroides intestinalis]